MHPRHARFVEEYARDWNATAAYKRAGYRARGHAAEVNASRLRRRPDVAAACAERLRAACAHPSEVQQSIQLWPGGPVFTVGE
jgi:phage terminase small subunit